MSEIYDRMHPDKNEFIKRIENYSKITYGTDAYSLSAKEALLILDLKAKYQNVENVRRILYELSTRCKCEISSRDLGENRQSFERLNVLIDDALAELGEKE